MFIRQDALLYESNVGMEALSIDYTTLFEYKNNKTRLPIYNILGTDDDIPTVSEKSGPYMVRM